MSETTVQRAGGYALAVQTVLPERGLAAELHSTYAGHGGKTRSLQLLIAADRQTTNIAVDHDAELDVLRDPACCVDDHAWRLLDALQGWGLAAKLTLPRVDPMRL